jgi:hypothetical protein
MPVEQITTRTRDLRMIEAFHADQVEGPLRLFDEQCLLFTFPPPVVLAAGSDGVDGYVLATNDGFQYQSILEDDAGGWAAIGRAGGYTALAGGFDGTVWRNCDATFTRWQQLFDLGEGLDCSDIEYNPDTNTVLAVFGDLANTGVAKLFRSVTNGSSWDEIDVPTDLRGGLRSLKYNPVFKTWFGVGRRNGLYHAIRSLDDGLTWEVVPGVSNTSAWLDVGVNPFTGATLFIPDGQTMEVSFDGGDTSVLGGTSGRLFNTGFSQDLSRWLTEASGWIRYSDDDGLTWTDTPKPPELPGGRDISDITWMDNVDNRAFLVVGRATGAGGFAAWSVDGINDWVVVHDDPDLGYFIANPLTPTEPPREFKLTMPVERYEQIQHWRMTNAESPVEIVQTDKDTRFRGLGLVDSDLGLTALTGAPEPAPDIAHTSEDQGASDPINDGRHFWPRSQVCRILGGYVRIHGDVGRASRYYNYPEELLGERCPQEEA